MKKWLFVLAAGTFLSLGACRTRMVRTRPADVVYTRPVAPGPGYIWIGGDWVWSGNQYRWTEGHWDRARPGRVWHPGGWVPKNNGYRWRKGHW